MLNELKLAKQCFEYGEGIDKQHYLKIRLQSWECCGKIEEKDKKKGTINIYNPFKFNII